MDSAPVNLHLIDEAYTISPATFRKFLQNERIRSDRYGTVFSVVSITLGNISVENRDRLLEEICIRKRAVDRIGWSEDDSMSLLLPDATRDGAKTFCEKLAGIDKELTKNLVFNIYAYPVNWLENSNIDDNQENCYKTSDADFSKNLVESMFVKKVPLWKRSMDVFFAALVLFFISPLFLFLSVFIKIVSPGPVFFHQVRIGYKGIPFRFWKFRTMKHNNNPSAHGKHLQSFIKNGDVPMKKLDGVDSRIIPGGRIIRASCLDELPQLWNVLKGDMSLIGPRPCIPYEARDYLRWHTHRFDTVPGMTGLWQVSGKERLTFKEMIRLDIAYCGNTTFFGDLKILFKTPLAIIGMVVDAFARRRSLDQSGISHKTFQDY